VKISVMATCLGYLGQCHININDPICFALTRYVQFTDIYRTVLSLSLAVSQEKLHQRSRVLRLIYTFDLRD